MAASTLLVRGLCAIVIRCERQRRTCEVVWSWSCLGAKTRIRFRPTWPAPSRHRLGDDSRAHTFDQHARYWRCEVETRPPLKRTRVRAGSQVTHQRRRRHDEQHHEHGCRAWCRMCVQCRYGEVNQREPPMNTQQTCNQSHKGRLQKQPSTNRTQAQASRESDDKEPSKQALSCQSATANTSHALTADDGGDDCALAQHDTERTGLATTLRGHGSCVCASPKRH